MLFLWRHPYVSEEPKWRSSGQLQWAKRWSVDGAEAGSMKPTVFKNFTKHTLLISYVPKISFGLLFSHVQIVFALLWSLLHFATCHVSPTHTALQNPGEGWVRPSGLCQWLLLWNSSSTPTDNDTKALSKCYLQLLQRSVWEVNVQ